MKLRGVGDDRGHLVFELRRDRDNFGECLRQHLRKLPDSLVHIDRLERGVAPSGECEQLPYEGGAPLDGNRDGFKPLLDLGRVGFVALHQGGVPENDPENVIKIVRYPAGQGSDAFHLLRLPELLLQFLAFRNISEKPAIGDRLPLRILNRPGVHENDAPFPVLSSDFQLKVQNRAVPGQLVFEDVAVARADIDVAVQINLEQLFLRCVPQEFDSRGVDVHQFSVRGAQEDGVFRFFKERPVLFLRKPEKFFRPFLLRHIALSPPNPFQQSLIHDAHEIIQEVPLGSRFVGSPRFGIRETVTGPNERTEQAVSSAVIRRDEISHSAADNLLRV